MAVETPNFFFQLGDIRFFDRSGSMGREFFNPPIRGVSAGAISASDLDVGDLRLHNLDGSFDGFELRDGEAGSVVAVVRKAAEQLVELEAKILADDEPWSQGKILSLYGQPGRGKTHLLNALINHLKEHAPTVLSSCNYLVGDEFTNEFQYYLWDGDPPTEVEDPFDIDKIIFVDDMFRDFEGVLSVDQLPSIAVERFGRFVRGIYEHKQLVVMTSNFRVLEPMHERLTMIDTVGRDTSRFAAVREGSKELLLPGNDYRLELSQRRLEEDAEFSL